jgi:carbon-monoxide dehydrogenase medium subunit
MHDFDYSSPATVDEAVTLLAKSPGQARPMAGGTDLIDHMRVGRLRPEVVVDVKQIPDLNVLEVTSAGARIGAAVPCYRIYGHEGLQRDYAALVDACSIIGGIQIQSRASIGGNLCTSGPAADSTPALIALGATCVIAGPKGRREVPVGQFCTGPGTNVLQPGELLVEIRLPASQPRSGSHYQRFIPRNEMDIAVVGVGAWLQLDDKNQTITAARIGLGAVGPTPIVAHAAAAAIIGQPPSDATWKLAADAARGEISPITDMRGTIEFRTHVTGVLVERVLRHMADKR